MSLVVPFEEIFADKTGLLANHSSWPRIELGHVTTILNGFPFKSSLFSSVEGFPIIRIRDIATSTTETRYRGHVEPNYIVRAGDILVGMDGNFRCFEWRGPDAGLNQRVCKIVPDERFLSRRFVLFGLNGYLSAIEKATSSVTVGHLSSRDIQRIPFPLPPLAEQRRIVAKLEQALAKIDASKQRLAKIPVLLKRFRQSVLAAACSGRLTADWRDAAREEQLRAQSPANSDTIRDVEPLFETPESWLWVPLVSVCDPARAICYGVIKLGAEHPDGVPCLRTSDVKPLYIDSTEVKRIAPEISNEFRRTLLRGGEVLVNVRGTLGGVAVVPSELRGWNISREVAMVPISEVLPAFIAFWIASTPCQNWLSGVAKGAAYTGINIEDLRLLPVSMPSTAEQHEIVRRVDALFRLADQIEARFEKAKAQVDKLTPALLAKAFRGELVPQDPHDEPASVLLERIRTERAAQSAGATKPTRKKRIATVR